MRLCTEAYTEQLKIWPKSGRHILAHYDERSIIVYQAYCPAIARYAIEHGRFGGADFTYSRMSWIKPGFLWMMYRTCIREPSSEPGSVRPRTGEACKT